MPGNESVTVLLWATIDELKEDRAALLDILREVREEGINIPSPLWVKVNAAIIQAEGRRY